MQAQTQTRPPKLGPRWTAMRQDHAVVVWLHHHPKRSRKRALAHYADQGVVLEFRPGRWAKQ